MKNTEKSKVKRAPKRGIYDKEEIFSILDRDFMCHVAFIHKGYPIVIPTMYGRKDEYLYFHGATVSRLINELESGVDFSVSVATVNGLVLARSAYHHSLNYESVVIFGKGELVPDDEKNEALKLISEHLIKGRWDEVRPPSTNELKGTKVIKFKIVEASAKVRVGDPVDENKDMDLDVWAGVLPIEKKFGHPIADSKLKESINEVSPSVLNHMKRG